MHSKFTRYSEATVGAATNIWVTKRRFAVLDEAVSFGLRKQQRAWCDPSQFLRLANKKMDFHRGPCPKKDQGDGEERWHFARAYGRRYL